MRNIFFLFLFLPLLLVAQKPEMSNKAVVNVMTYDDKGELLHSTYGFFCSPTADIIMPFHALKSAVRAEVIDATGKRGEIIRIQGASKP